MTAPVILWFRRDLRLSDLPMLAGLGPDRPVLPVFILDPETETWGAAPKLRLDLALAAFGRALEARGSRLILRRGPASAVLAALAAETGAGEVRWTRLYDPAARDRDTAVKAALRAAGLKVESYPGHLLVEPWEVTTGEGGFYRVYSPFRRAVERLAVPAPAPAPAHLPAPADWPASDRLEDWRLAAPMRRGGPVVAARQSPGEAAARDRLARFLQTGIGGYAANRDRLDMDGTSGLSEHLTLGEIGIREVWHAADEAGRAGAPGAATFGSELLWREFAWHLLYHTPHLARDNWRPDWDSFPWDEEGGAALLRWQQGRTGDPLVDAAMRQLYVTGTMHNRARMVVASYLTKHLMIHWRRGLDWFADCLTDWDPAANAMGWQWVAGSGPDAAPYFRIFNPVAQAARFDPEGRYRDRWLAEGRARPGADALAFFDAVPVAWALDPRAPLPAPLVDHGQARARALAAYAARGA